MTVLDFIRVFKIGKWVCLSLVLCIWIGCAKAKKDNLFDPSNQPFILSVQSPIYDAQENAIVLSWQYYGRAIQSYILTRRNVRTNETKIWEQTTPLSSTAPFDTEYDVQPVQKLVDPTALVAGEEYIYEIEVEDTIAKTPGALGRIQIPGARLEEISLDLKARYATIQWRKSAAVEQAVQYDIVRQENAGSQTIIFTTRSQDLSHYIDTDIAADMRYRYLIRSTLPDGSIWDSRALQSAFFLFERDWDFLLDPGAYPYLASGGGSLYTFSSASTNGRLDTYNQSGMLARTIGTIPHVQTIRPENFSLAILDRIDPPPPNSNAIVSTTNYYIASVVNSEVYLEAYSSTNLTTPIPWTPEPWPVSDETHVSLEINGSDNAIYVLAGNQLRHYFLSLDQRGNIDLGITSNISDFALDESEHVWAVLPDERRILKSPPAVIGTIQFQFSQWQEIILPPGTVPHAITSGANQGQVFLILDAENRRVLIYTSEGDLIFTLDNLEGLNFNRDGRLIGDIEVLDTPHLTSNPSPFGAKVYVLDAWGKVRQFETFFYSE